MAKEDHMRLQGQLREIRLVLRERSDEDVVTRGPPNSAELTSKASGSFKEQVSWKLGG